VSYSKGIQAQLKSNIGRPGLSPAHRAFIRRASCTDRAGNTTCRAQVAQEYECSSMIGIISMRPNLSLSRPHKYVDLHLATLAGLLMLVSLSGAAHAGPLDDAEAADRKDDYATAIPIYRSLAEKGDVSSQKRLGFFYEIGVGVKRDWMVSASWFSKAAAAGDESAVFELSFLGRHRRDRGSASGTPIIYELVEKVAKSGFAVAQFSLGVMYYPIGDPSFDATKGNPAKALVWYRRAAQQGNFDSEIALGMAYSEGIGVVQDNIEADKWYNIAASQAKSADELANIATYHNKLAHTMTSS
jgi:uncharacterized protein